MPTFEDRAKEICQKYNYLETHSYHAPSCECCKEILKYMLAIRNETLEEAARIAENEYTDFPGNMDSDETAKDIAKAIRLKIGEKWK